MHLRKFVSVILFSLGTAFTSTIAQADIIYSGLRNIVLTASPEEMLNEVIDLAGDVSNDWDDLQFDMYLHSHGASFGSSTAWFGSPVVLAYESSFPNVERYEFGDAMTGSFGSGSFLLWYFDAINGFDNGLFHDGFGYAGMMLNSFGENPLYGWIQLHVSNYDNSDGLGTVLTIVDWAYETTGQRIDIGAGATTVAIPVSGSASLLLIGLIALTLRNRNQQVQAFR